ncbi:50S ribosomal protein L3, partial [Nanoarchaeota archaeon]
MPKQHQPRSGSMQFWPRKRAKRSYARVRAWNKEGDAKPLAFAGYKAGMTHIMGIDNRKASTKKGMEIPYPVTIIECPPMKIVSIRFYDRKGSDLFCAKEIFVGNDKALARRLDMPKKVDKSDLDKINLEDYEDITILVHTLPGMTGIGKKKPEVFEVHLGGKKEDKLAYVKQAEVFNVTDIFEEGDMVDAHAISTGKGYQGPVKRFGIGLKSHKSEKGRRRPGSLGGWKGQQHFMYRAPMAGQMGYQQRVHYNSQVMKIGDKPEEINARGGFINYGMVKNPYML